MGRAYLFECSRCNYRSVVVGGADRGTHCFVQTIHCLDCGALMDVPVRLRLAEYEVHQPYRLWPRNLLNLPEAIEPPTGFPWQNCLAYGSAQKSKWVAVRIRCPVSPYHRIQHWQEPGKCPRCGTHLERGLTPYRVWE